MAVEPPRRAAVVSLAVTLAALAVVLAVPNLFSDPNGLDPHRLRLSGVSLALTAASFAGPARLAAGRPVLLALSAATISFSVLSGGPQLLGWLGAGGLPGTAQVLVASAGQAGVTAALVWLAVRGEPAGRRPELRVGSLRSRAVLAGVAGTALLLTLGLAVPAPLLGRLGVPLQAVQRDLVWLAPACLLQALAQELQFRGLLMGALERVASPRSANLAQAGIFAVAHLAIPYPGPVAPFVPVTLALGLALGWAVRRTASLWPAVVIHAAGDIAITVTVLPGLYGS